MTPIQYVRSGDVDIAVYTWGKPSKRPPLVLVHGYPDCSEVWAGVAELLAKQHFVIAYDVRGCGLSSVPKRVRDYRITTLNSDLMAVLDAVCPQQKVHLIGHDWGSIQSWEAVTTTPSAERFLSYQSISGPSLDHVGHWMRARINSRSALQLRDVLKQLGHSWYMMFFQIPGIAPALWQFLGDKAWPRIMKGLDGTVAAATKTQVKDGSNGINLYRANILQRLLQPQLRYTSLPVQLIVPSNDPFVSQNLYSDLARWAPNLWRRDIDAGHWVSLSHPLEIAELIREFVSFVDTRKESATLKAARLSQNPLLPVATRSAKTAEFSLSPALKVTE